MSIVSKIKIQLKENNAAVLKKFGQNFLVSKAVLAKIIAAADLKPQDTILEIGPGLGALTFELAKRVKKVVAVEKDRKISAILEKNLAEKGVSNVKVINHDILNFQFLPQRHSEGAERPKNLNKINDGDSSPSAQNDKIEFPYNPNYKLISNLPYNIATAVIMKFLESQNPPKLMVVMVQKEVAQRICAKPPHMNKLAIFCQLYSQLKIISYVSSTAFWPKPKVDSAILQLTPKKPKELSSFVPRRSLAPSVSLVSIFRQVVNIGFSHPRKTLLNNLARGLLGGGLPSFNLEEGSPPQISKEMISQWLLQNNINPMQRPETLSVENWQNLTKTLKRN